MNHEPRATNLYGYGIRMMVWHIDFVCLVIYMIKCEIKLECASLISFLQK